MEKATRDGEFYQQLHKLLNQYLYQTGIPYLNLEITMDACPLSEKLQKISLNVPQLSDLKANQVTTKDDYIFRVDMCLNYRGQQIGSLKLNLPQSDFPNSRVYEVFEPLSNQIVQLLSRNRLVRESRRIFGKTLNWLGTSLCIQEHERNIDALAEIESNIVIFGGSNSGKLITGLSFHIFGPRRDYPFITTNCADWDQQNFLNILPELFKNANGGTIYFRHFECLSREIRSLVVAIVRKQEKNSNSAETQEVCGAVFSCNSLDMIGDQRSRYWTYPGLVAVEMPCLTERKADIKEIGKDILDEFCRPSRVKISERGWLYIEQLNWKNGVEQLELVIFNLLKRSQKSILNYELLTNLIPKIDRTLQVDVDIKKRLSVKSLAKKVATDELLDLSCEHPAIRKAITYLALNYRRNFELKILARQACVSSSHLSFLLRKHLGASYKQILNQCRIEKAKRLLIISPAIQITEISARLGFCDLSHFEKTFRKKVGESPKQFKRRKLSEGENKLLLFRKNG